MKDTSATVTDSHPSKAETVGYPLWPQYYYHTIALAPTLLSCPFASLAAAERGAPCAFGKKKKSCALRPQAGTLYHALWQATSAHKHLYETYIPHNNNAMWHTHSPACAHPLLVSLFFLISQLRSGPSTLLQIVKQRYGDCIGNNSTMQVRRAIENPTPASTFVRALPLSDG